MNPTKNLRHTHGLLLAAALLSCHASAIAQRHLAEVGADCSSLEYHLRLAPLKNTDSRCSLIWNYTDSANFRALRYTIPSLSSSDNLAGFESQYELIEYKDGAETIVAAGSFRDSYTSHPALSAMLRVLPSSACVDIGSGKARCRFRLCTVTKIRAQDMRAATSYRSCATTSPPVERHCPKNRSFSRSTACGVIFPHRKTLTKPFGFISTVTQTSLKPCRADDTLSPQYPTAEAHTTSYISTALIKATLAGSRSLSKGNYNPQFSPTISICTGSTTTAL